MEEEKAAAYYEELTRKGEGAAKFKQGLGFSSSASSDPFPSKKSSSSTFFSNFVRASSPKYLQPEEYVELNKRDHARVLDSIQSKLKSGSGDSRGRRSPFDDDRERRKERRERNHEKERGENKHSSRYTRESERDRDRDRERRRKRSRSYSPARVSHSRDRDQGRDRDGDRDRGHTREKDNSLRKSSNKSEKGVDYAQLIDGYSQMTPAERVKAKMKFQLSQTAEKDTAMGTSTGWERFDFNRDAPLDDDDDDEPEVTEDDKHIVKNIGRSFRFSAVEARREEEVKAAHDEAMFGGATRSSTVNFAYERIRSPQDDEKNDDEHTKGVGKEDDLNNSVLVSDKVLSMQQGSWRDRARKLQNGSERS